MNLSSIRAAGWTGASIVVGSAMLLGLAACGGAPPVSATPSPELQGMIEQKAEAAAPESQAVGALFRGVGYRKGEFQDFHVELEAGNCYWFVAAGDPGITAFTLTVWDGSKDEVGQDKSKSREALVEHCPKKTGTFKFQGKVGRGAGHFAIGLFAKAAPEDAAPVEEGPKKADLEQMITDEASSVAPEATQVGNFYKTNKETSDFYVELEKGKCYWFIGAAQPSVDDYYIYLWDQAKKRIGETKADGNKAQFGHCPDKGGMFHLQVKVDDASDVVELGVFGKKSAGDDGKDKSKGRGK